MATLQIVSVSPSNHVLPGDGDIVIRFVRSDNSSDKVRVRIQAQGQSAVVTDATGYTEFTDGTCTTTLSASLLTAQMGVTYKVGYSLDITCFETAPAVLDWTQVTTFTMYGRPAIVNLTPAAGTTMEGYPLVVSWEVDPEGADDVMASQRLTVFDGTSQSYAYDQQIEPTTRSMTLGLDDVTLVSGRTYYVAIECVNDVGLSARAEHNFSTYWEPPLEPSATVEVDEDALGATITVHAGEDVSDWLIKFVGTEAVVRDGYLTVSGTDAVINATYTVADGNIQFDSPSAPATQSLMLVRINQDGTRWVIATGLTSGEVVQDPLPPLGVEYQYEVTAIDANGSTNVSAVSMTISSRYWLLNFGNDASEYVRLIGNPKASRSMKHGGAVYHFADGGAGGGLPVWYGTTDRDYSGSWSFDEVGPDVADDLFAKCDQWPVCWMRDPFGRRRRAHVEPREAHAKGLLWQVSVDYDEMRFREAW